MQSHYESLEISELASDEEIKKSYRKLAMKWHPDRNHDDKNAEEKFKEIKLAYETLIHPHKKRMYDLSRGGNKNENSKYNPHTSTKNFSGVVDLNLGFWEAIFGCKKIFDFSSPGRVEKQTIVVTLPPGTSNGETFLYEKDGIHLTLNISVLEDDKFTRNNLDLFVNIEIPFTVAALGGEIKFPHWSGEFIVKIPTGLKNNQSVLMPNMGVKRGMFIGDLYLVCGIGIPKHLTSKQKALLEEFQQTEIIESNNLFETIKNTWKKFF